MTKLGTGILTWDRGERVSDRYGTVWLMASGNSMSDKTTAASLTLCTRDIGRTVTLKAKVLETRQSTHIGDLFHAVFPSTPEVGEIVTLGTGTLFYEDETEDNNKRVGVKPLDARPTLWLDIVALYRVHEQTVELFYEAEL